MVGLRPAALGEERGGTGLPNGFVTHGTEDLQLPLALQDRGYLRSRSYVVGTI